MSERKDLTAVIAALQQLQTKRQLRPATVAEKLGVSLPTVWRYCRNIKSFPRPIKLSPRVTVFDEDELDAYLNALRGGQQ